MPPLLEGFLHACRGKTFTECVIFCHLCGYYCVYQRLYYTFLIIFKNTTNTTSVGAGLASASLGADARPAPTTLFF